MDAGFVPGLLGELKDNCSDLPKQSLRKTCIKKLSPSFPNQEVKQKLRKRKKKVYTNPSHLCCCRTISEQHKNNNEKEDGMATRNLSSVCIEAKGTESAACCPLHNCDERRRHKAEKKQSTVPHYCALCGKEFRCLRNAKLHLMAHHRMVKVWRKHAIKLRCPEDYCKSFQLRKTKRELAKSRRAQCKNKKMRARVQALIKAVIRKYCEGKRTGERSASNRKSHIYKLCGNMYACTTCSKPYKTFTPFLKHLNQCSQTSAFRKLSKETALC